MHAKPRQATVTASAKVGSARRPARADDYGFGRAKVRDRERNNRKAAASPRNAA
jgi:hypothetical protein